MCGRYSVLTEDEIIEVRRIIRSVALGMMTDELEDAVIKAQSEQSGQSEASHTEVFPTDISPIITGDESELSFQYAKFGFEKWDGKGAIINARAETVMNKQTFREHIKNGRCVIPTSGYFEWKAPEEGQKKKTKHLIKDEQGNLLFMAGLWREGVDGNEFVVITKAPYGEITHIHDRMPVILRTDQLEAWLSGVMPIEELALLNYECVGSLCEEQEKCDSGNKQISLFD